MGAKVASKGENRNEIKANCIFSSFRITFRILLVKKPKCTEGQVRGMMQARYWGNLFFYIGKLNETSCGFYDFSFVSNKTS